jgi:hypothetical protein
MKKPQLAPGYKWCPRCRSSLSLREFNNDSRRRDGKYLYCRSCSNRAARRYYATRHVADAESEYVPSGACHVPPELFPPPAPGEGIGCLRCRHARLMAQSRFTKTNHPKIYCARQATVAAIVWQNCEIADPRPMKPRDLRRYWFKHGPLGDKLGHAGDVVKAYLAARWAHEAPEVLERVTGWTMFKLAQIVRYHGIGGAKTNNNRLHHMNPRKGRVCFSPEQTAFLMREYSSPRWPKVITWNMASARKAARRRAQNKLVAQCNELGPAWNWEQICRHVEKQMRKRGDRAKARRRGEGRKVNQFVTLPAQTTKREIEKP